MMCSKWKLEERFCFGILSQEQTIGPYREQEGLDAVQSFRSLLTHRGSVAWNQTLMSRRCDMLARKPLCSRRLRSNRSAHQCCQFGVYSNGTWASLCLTDHEPVPNNGASRRIGFNVSSQIYWRPPSRKPVLRDREAIQLARLAESRFRASQCHKLPQGSKPQSNRVDYRGHPDHTLPRTACGENYRNSGKSDLNAMHWK